MMRTASGPCSAMRPVRSDSSTNSTPSGRCPAIQPTSVCAVGGVRDDQVLEVAGVVHDQVVDDAAVLVAHHRVDGATQLVDLVQVVGDDPLQRVEGLEAEDPELRHVADVEDAGRGTHRAVLLDDPGVLHGHLEAGERDHARPECDVLLVQRRARRARRTCVHPSLP